MRTPTDAGIDRLLRVVRATRPLPVPPALGGGMVFSSNLGGHVQVYRLDRPGGEPKLLVETPDRTVADQFVGGALILRHDRGGDERWQLSRLDTDGAVRPLTTDAAAIYQAPLLRPGAGTVAATAWNPGGRADVAIGQIDLASGELQEWLTPGAFWNVQSWRPDGGALVVGRPAGSQQEAFLLELGDGRARIGTPILPAAHHVHVSWHASGLFALTDFESDFRRVVEIDPAHPDQPVRVIFAPGGEIEAFVPNRFGTRALVAVNQGAYDRLLVLDLRTGGVSEEPQLPAGVALGDHTGHAEYHLNWDEEGNQAFAAWETPVRPAEIFDLAGRRWTAVNPPAFEAGLVTPAETAYQGHAGLRVPALHYRSAAPRPAPFLVYFHGGPESQMRGNFQPIAQLMVQSGIDVFLPNVRGSSGYGLSYLRMDDRTLRADAVRDGSAAGRHLKTSGQASRVAAMGGSYGGFMTLAVLVDSPDLWDAGVDVVGIADWHSFFRNMPPWRGVLRKREYGDPEGAEAEFLRQLSPLHQADRIRCPLLVVHGRNDPRVPVVESEAIARATGAELLIFEDEGHGISKLANQDRFYRLALSFLTRHLARTTSDPEVRL